MRTGDSSNSSPDSPMTTAPALKRSPPRLPILAPLINPTPGLAPLEYLQLNQRRGSITDPSLHASSHSHSLNQNQDQGSSSNSPPRHSFPPPTSGSSASNSSFAPRASFSFPPSTKQGGSDHPMDHPPPNRPWSAQNGPAPHEMDVEGRNGHGPDQGRSSSQLAYLSSPRSFSGTKRKMSHDSARFLLDEGKPSSTFSPFGPSPGGDGPLPKRRGSAFDTQRMAHLSIQDRRDSIDSRSSVSAGSIGGWAADRRDSAASMYSTTSVGSNLGGYSSASGSESTTKSYAWPPAMGQHTHDSADHNNGRPYAFPSDPNPSYLPPAPPIPSVHFSANVAAARRLSVPDVNLPLNGARTRTRGSSTASLREQVKAELAMNSTTSPTSTSGGQSDSAMANDSQMRGISPTDSIGDSGSQLGVSQYANHNGLSGQSPTGGNKETPYSRSPELRISHKLAERKRRKEMKDLFDELRDQLPADRGMKASKWEILSKAVDYIAQLKVAYTTMSEEIERLRHDMETMRPASMGQQVSYHPSPVPPGPTQVHMPVGMPIVAVSSHASPPATAQPLPSTSNGKPHSNSNGTSFRPSSAESENGRSTSTQSSSQPSSAVQSPFQQTHQLTPTPQQGTQPLPAK